MKWALVMVAVAVVSMGSVMVLAPQQVAEAVAAARDLVCNGCVGTTDIADNAVTSAKIGDTQVKHADIDAQAVDTANLAFQSVTSDKIRNGEVNTEDLASGAIKPNVQRVARSITVHPGEGLSVAAICPAGTVVSGGGFGAPDDTFKLFRSDPNILPDGTSNYVVGGTNTASGDRDLTAYALCIGPSP